MIILNSFDYRVRFIRKYEHGTLSNIVDDLNMNICHDDKNFKKANSTRCSQAVSHPSTIRTQCCLTSVIGRDLVCSTGYGRWRRLRWSDLFKCLKFCHALLWLGGVQIILDAPIRCLHFVKCLSKQIKQKEFLLQVCGFCKKSSDFKFGLNQTNVSCFMSGRLEP